MSKRCLMFVILALGLGGCVGDQQDVADDVASQVSAIDEADMTPLPGESEEQMHSRWILGECTRSCFNQGRICGAIHCHDSSPGACPDSCQGNESDCLAVCLCTWGDHPEGVCYGQ